MHPAPLLVALALGVDVGWKPLPEGGLEYIIQIEPELLNSLRSGQTISSDVPLVLRDIRRYRIQVGDGRLPQEGTLDTPMPGAEPEPAKQPQAAVKRPQVPANTADTEAPRFVSTAPAAGKAADLVKKPAAEAPAATPAPASTEETPDPFAKDANAKDAPAAEEANDKAPASEDEIEGPLFAADAAMPPVEAADADKNSMADEQPRLDRDQDRAANEMAENDGRAAQPTVVQKVASQRPTEDPPLRGGDEAGSGGSGSESESAAPREPDKPWVWLTLALMGLAGSATVNVYQGLLHLSMRSKYRGVVRKLHDAESQLASQPSIEAGWPDEQAGVDTVEAGDYEYEDDR
jgi:hypothetical protein